jgi:hypothetical protein
MPEAASLVGIEPARIDIGLDLTPEVAAAVPEAVAAVRAELRPSAGNGKGAASDPGSERCDPPTVPLLRR